MIPSRFAPSPLFHWCRRRPTAVIAWSGGGRAGLAVVACLLGWAAALRGAVISVQAGDNLQAKIDGAAGGDVLMVGTGTYAGFQVDGRHFTAEHPLVIKAAPGARPVIRGRNYEGYLAKLTECSYLVLDGLTLEKSNQPIYCVSVDHLILVNLTIHDTGQELIHLRGASRSVDIRHCRLYDSGHAKPQWSEGIYVGMGQPPFESVEHVWIEGNEIYRTGNSEAVNLKARCYHVTVRGNRIHDLAPGTATQYNCAGIACEAADLDFRPGVDTDIWIEDNDVSAVVFGRWANGIQTSTMGPRLVRNHIHDCQEYGIEFSDYLNGPGARPTWIFGNVIERCAAGAMNKTAMSVKTEDPGPNPNRPQAWYSPEVSGPPGAR